jgi:hypothetical protein
MKNAMGKRNPFPLVGQIHQTGPTREAYTQPVPASLSTAAAKWARRAGVAHWLVTASMWARLSGCFFPQIPLLTCASSATGFPSLSRLSGHPHHLSPLLQSRLTYARHLGLSCLPLCGRVVPSTAGTHCHAAEPNSA